MQLGGMVGRALKTSALFAIATTILLLSGGRTDWAISFGLGALMSLFSLLSLTIIVPALIRPGAPQFSRSLLNLTLLLKLPLYAAGLYLIMRLPRSAPAAAAAGIGLVPGVITLNALGSLATNAAREQDSSTNAV